MAELPEFQKRQYAFAAHIRDPEHVVAPEGVEDRRMAIYRHLFFNNLRNLLSNMFPVLKKLLPETKWCGLIRQFMQLHRAKTPYFLQLPEEFLAFLENEYELQQDDFPFLIELAHYEYIELALSISEERNDLTGVDPDGDLLMNVPVKSDLTWVYAYQYPVHRISSDYIPAEPAEQPVFLAVYRGNNDKVGFLELNPITAALLELIGQNDSQASGEGLLRALAAQTKYPDVDALIQHGAAALEEMRQLEILTGTRTPA
ncbi:MAG: putative DNA-binding domain-containing protein [Gammaproteobacteria bacterium]|nr:putative DNA-binding domain-containing protein [Gammaproteobacteria bacterium]MDH3372466.1 putative DNA-binding domain-containing protein [Gammaproteobacteria bacterium]MDH3407902.1 putative DNA-binding domain-containing protein [Gammaproteobacteria bacterium]MDH3551852.1 putative DNA-binding domain-containing protein [Gammaproteobacteria bacterium]